MKQRHKSTRKHEAGYVLLATTVGLVVLIGMSGIAVDIGRMYMTKNETQAYADSAALTAALKLDGTATGIQLAKDSVAASNNKWRFNVVSFTGTVVEFSTDGTSGWDANPANPTNFRYVRVTATAPNLDLFLLPVVGTPNQVNIPASAIAGQLLQTTFGTNSNTGILPFSPYAHAEGANSTQVLASDPTGNFGFTPGNLYTIRWPSNPRTNGHNPNVCSGDMGPAGNLDQWVNKADAQSNSERGYIQDTSASAIRAAIEDDHMDFAVSLDQAVNMSGGAKGTEGTSLENRILQDTDSTTNPYSAYVLKRDGNGRRVVTVPINSGPRDNAGVVRPTAEQNVVVGFAQFFLWNQNYEHSGNESWCAEYIGPGALIISGSNTGAGGSSLGGYVVRLIQ